MANTLKFGAGQWATKEGSTLAYNDENDNYKPLPFDFTRASNATVVNKAGLIETVGNGIPRIDFLGNTQGALKLEPQRTNNIQWSDLFSASSTGGYYGLYWNAIITDNNAISPDGSLNASKVVRGTDNVVIRAGSVVTVSNEYTATLWAKKGNYDKIMIDIGDEAASTITLTDEWQRIETTATPTLNTHVDISMPNSASGDYIYIYGFQVEEGSYATSYIPTQGSAVTRLSDSCSQTPPDGVIGQTEGSIFIELDVNTRALSSSWAFSLNDGTTSNYIGLRRSGGAEFFVHISVSGTTTALIGTGITSGKNKISIGYASNNIIVYVNGVNVGTDTSSNIPTTSDLQIGNLISNRALEDSVSGFKLYNTRLSNAELQALTT